MNTKPLSGTRVLDLTHMLSGPYGTMILADLGAETIKVEPLAGEGTRALLAKDPKNSLGGMGAYFLTLNRNKQSVCIDLKSTQGLELFYQLVATADVVVDNFSAGVTQKLGIDYPRLVPHNPRIITATISGFGSDGPRFQRPAFDQVVQAIGGGMSITGADPEHPTRAGIPIGDLGGGMFAVMGILAALVERNVSGRGQHVDISMLDCQISMLNYMATMHFLSGENPHPIGNAHFVHVPYNTFRTADGFIVIAVIFDQFWGNLAELLCDPELQREEFNGQPGRLAAKAFIEERLNAIFATNTSAHWLAALERARIPCAPVNRFSEALSDSQVLHRNMVVELRHPNGESTRGPGNPIKLSRTPGEDFTPPPLLGQHTRDVLGSLLGVPAEALERLASDGVIA
jgi:crotonobetainyl-CoA:carnitine CoA-transferase CaiB-like acyl-CoA transferase